MKTGVAPNRIRARSVRADGQVQDGEPRPPFPSGVSGYHEVVVCERVTTRGLDR